MKKDQDLKLFRSLLKIDRAITKKYSLGNLITAVKQEIKNNFRNARVSVIFGQTDAVKFKGQKIKKKKSAGSLASALGTLVMKKKKSVVVAKDLAKFCKKHSITPVGRATKSVLASPIQHRGNVYGAVIVENMKEPGAFAPEDETYITMLAGCLGAEISSDRLLEDKNRLEAEIRHLALFDPLTKLPNQRYFDLIVEMELKKAKGYSRQLSLAIIDLDRFRSLNARLGKKVGNDMLVHVAQTLKRNVRDTDFVARRGGEEFVILLPEALNEAAVNVADRVRVAVERAPLPVKGLGKKRVTISVGVVTYPSSAESLPALIEQAEKALKRAKQLGRNQVVAL